MEDSELKKLKATKVVDGRDHACPGPLIEAKRSMASIPVGGILEIWASDQVAVKEIPIWAGGDGQEFLGVLAADGYERIFVRRKR